MGGHLYQSERIMGIFKCRNKQTNKKDQHTQGPLANVTVWTPKKAHPREPEERKVRHLEQRHSWDLSNEGTLIASLQA